MSADQISLGDLEIGRGMVFGLVPRLDNLPGFVGVGGLEAGALAVSLVAGVKEREGFGLVLGPEADMLAVFGVLAVELRPPGGRGWIEFSRLVLFLEAPVRSLSRKLTRVSASFSAVLSSCGK